MNGPEGAFGPDAFASARQRFEDVVSFLGTDGAMALEHGALEERLEEESRAVFRRLFQDHLVVRAQREVRLEVVDAAGTARTSVEAGHGRTLATVFGEVTVERLAYRRRGEENLHPADASLNLPEEKHSHGLRRLSAIEATRGSYDGATDAIERATGQTVGKRQVESLVLRAAADVDDFYAERGVPDGDREDALVISVDAKGIVMRTEALRQATKKTAESSSPKMQTRLSKGEKHGRKRLAELGTVYDVTPVVRRATDVFAGTDDERVEGPEAKNKWLTASVVEDAAEVIGDVFDEAERRDPEHQRTWVALVDGNSHQIDRIEKEAERRKLKITVVVDLIHVLEYLWTAAWCFFDEGDTTAEAWVRDRALAVLGGGALDVAAGIRRRRLERAAQGSGAQGCRRLRPLPDQQGHLPRLPDSPRDGLADRHGHHRRSVPTHREGPDGSDRCPVGPGWRRSRSQAPCRAQQRRLRRVLAVPPVTRARPCPPIPLRRQHHPHGCITSLERSRTQSKPSTP